MNALTRRDHVDGLEDLQHNLPILFSRPPVHWPEQHLGPPQWIPLVVVSENARGYVLKAELPQVKQADVKITIDDGTLTITGDRKFEQNHNKDHRVEHALGRFAHSFVLPIDARPARVSAVFKNGVLIVHLAKNDAIRATTACGRAWMRVNDPLAVGIEEFRGSSHLRRQRSDPKAGRPKTG
jgi:HSP20 family protein